MTEMSTEDILRADRSRPAAPQSATERRAFSCVVDDDPVIMAQSYLWVNCLVDLQSVSPQDIYVHTVNLSDPEYLSWLRSTGVRICPVEPFDAASPWCNKLAQLDTFSGSGLDQIVLMDCDTAWVGDKPFPRAAAVAAKVVDFPRPPEAVLQRIFQAAGLEEPGWANASFPDALGRRKTALGNCNGGLSIWAGRALEAAGPVWRKWARWGLEHIDLFGEFSMHVDQVSLALALHELGLEVEPLDLEWNFPTHLRGSGFPDLEPQIIHYHRELTPHFRVKTVGRPRVDATIDRLNAAIPRFFARNFPNAVFWNLRYRVDPELGSGVGSRSESLAIKRALLSQALQGWEDRAVMDIGCGDLEATRHLQLRNYVGIDVSREALRIAERKRPDWTFRPDWDETTRADVVICLDVLLHQKTEAEFQSLLSRLVDAATERLIVSGYNRPPAFTSEIVAYHGPLVEVLQATGKFTSVKVIGEYRDISVVVADKRPASGQHHHKARRSAVANSVTGPAPKWVEGAERPWSTRHGRSAPVFSRDAFSANVPQWTRLLASLHQEESLEFLEIGSYEGRSALWMLQNFPQCIVHCIDTFEGAEDERVEDKEHLLQDWLFERFSHNISPYGDRVQVHRGQSQEILRGLGHKPRFDFVYIDGSHAAADVLEDAVLAFRLLKPGRRMIFDDYLWRYYEDELMNPKIGIQAFLASFARELTIIEMGYQVCIERRLVPERRLAALPPGRRYPSTLAHLERK